MDVFPGEVQFVYIWDSQMVEEIYLNLGTKYHLINAVDY